MEEMQWFTDMHKRALVLADAQIPQTWTPIVTELREYGALDCGRFYIGQFGQGWLFTVTTRGTELMEAPHPMATGNGKRLTTWAGARPHR